MVRLSLPKLSFVALALAAQEATAHIAFWHPAMFGWDANNINQNDAVTPLADMTFDQWWFHGYKDRKPAAGTFLELPAGGVVKGEVACNKAQTTWNPEVKDESQLLEYACDTVDPLHTTDRIPNDDPTNVKGCGLAIAYTSDENSVRPEDFTVFSVDHNCPWKRNVEFPVPADLPACPEGGCLCSWGWIHSPDSGSEQIYHLVYRCNVTGATETRALPAPLTANKCEYPSNTANCTVGGKQPHYWLQKEGNNNFQDYYDPPYYNAEYGFMQGAQTDLFKGVAAAQTSVVVSNTPAETVASASTTEMASPSIIQASSTSVAQPSSSSIVQASPLSTVQASSSSVAQASSTSGRASSTSVIQAVASSKASAPSTIATSESANPTSIGVSSTSAPAASKASTTTEGAVAIATSKTCKRSRRRSLEHHALRLSKRNTRASRAAAAAETVHKRAMLQDRQRLYAEGLARLAGDKVL